MRYCNRALCTMHHNSPPPGVKKRGHPLTAALPRDVTLLAQAEASFVRHIENITNSKLCLALANFMELSFTCI